MQVIKYLHIHLLSTQLHKQDNTEFQVYSHTCFLQSLHTSKKMKIFEVKLVLWQQLIQIMGLQFEFV